MLSLHVHNISLYKSTPIQYGAKVQHIVEPDTSPHLTKDQIQNVQDIIGTLLYYGQVVDPTMVTALISIASCQAKGIEEVLSACHQILDYVANHTNNDI